jgi:hypothetical protein
MKLGYVMELTLAGAVGLALARLWMEGSYFSMYGFPMMTYSFITGVVIVEAIGLWIEKARRRGPKPWGIGRLTWSTLGIVCLFQWSWDTIWYVLRQYGDVMASQESVWKLFRVTAGGSHTLAWIPLALIITTRLAGLPRDLRPDAREWAGRLFGSFILILYIFNDCYSLWAHGWDKIVWRH